MSRRARGMSVSQKPAVATASAPQAKTEDASGHKRKLSANAVVQEEAKKSKPAPEDDEEEEDEDQDKDDENEDKEDEDDEDDDDEGGQTAKQLDGPGPHAVYLWADGITSLIESEEDSTYVVLKSTALDAYRKVAHLADDEARTEAILPHIESDVQMWTVTATDEAREKPAALALVEKFNALPTRKAYGGEDGEGGEGGDDGVKEAGVHWWHELTLERERPKGDAPHIEVTLENAGDWYLTDIKPADKEGDAAMTIIVNWTANSLD
ncbi:hypothetical protein PsYK624_065170 [Phanerochaete sordida]|uniref:Uncharacterized protein n=1 Tax=Phanerochaete sordida TaxID=48140 RepID=A0A9P3LCD3_9APHY|nr:hypothetical protein PsYK624_065170 [Phanerochaete sordida]